MAENTEEKQEYRSGGKTYEVLSKENEIYNIFLSKLMENMKASTEASTTVIEKVGALNQDLTNMNAKLSDLFGVISTEGEAKCNRCPVKNNVLNAALEAYKECSKNSNDHTLSFSKFFILVMNNRVLWLAIALAIAAALTLMDADLSFLQR